MIDRAPGSTGEEDLDAPAPSTDEESSTASRQLTVLVLGADVARRDRIVGIIEETGWLPLVADDRTDAVRIVRGAPPDLFVLLVQHGSDDDLAVLDEVRNAVDGELVPIVCMLERRDRALTIDAFGRRADDVVWGTIHPSELVARLRARIERRPVPATELVEDPVTGALTPRAFGSQLSKEHERVARGGRDGALVFLSLDELPGIAARRGSRARDELLAQVVRLIEVDGRQLDFVGSRRGVLALLLPGTPSKGAQARCDRLARKIYDHEFNVDGEAVALTPIIGFTESTAEVSPDELEDRAWDAMAYQAAHLDLHPTRWVSAMSTTTTAATGLKRTFDRYRTLFQVVAQQLTVFVLPLLTYWLLDSIGADITGFVYIGLVLALGITATLIWGESHSALEPTVPPEAPDQPPPRASAIIAAYLPNEAGTVVETVEAFLEQDYPDLEVILAYNTPTPLEVEGELRAIANRDPRFVPLRVDGSVSKAQNVNAALAHVAGEFLGLFDADHHPAPGSFHRAWCWIADGAGVVQGHCVIRNGDTNLVTRLVATEFEAIYAVSHPGRARLQGFGIFGGSNGYWRTSLLHRTRMRGSMLTEDIDSSMRVVQSGEVIISDPELISTELAPDTAQALWNQRLRWAQGWSQVSLRHLIQMTRDAPTLRQRLGIAYLLGWREIYPWISLQMFPLLAYWWLQGEPAIEWFVPIFVFTTVLTFSAGPVQTWYAWRLAHPSIKQHKRWFVTFLLSSLVFYTEVKNVVARTAHLKELMRERKWKVTPRSGSVALDAEAASEEPPPIRPTPREDEQPTSSGEPHDPGADAERPAARRDDPSDEPPHDDVSTGSATNERGARDVRPEPESLGSGDVPGGEVLGSRDETPASAGRQADEPRSPAPPVRHLAHGDPASKGPPHHRRGRRPVHRRAGARRHRQPGLTAPLEPRPTIYDFERELTVYDVERESAIYDVEAEPPDDTLDDGTASVRRPRPIHGAAPSAAIDPLAAPGHDGRRPMIADVDGGHIAANRGIEPPPTGSESASVGAEPSELRTPLVSPLGTDQERNDGPVEGPPAGREARRTRRLPADDSTRPGS